MKKLSLWLLVLMVPLLVTGCKSKKGDIAPVENVELTEEQKDMLEPSFESIDYGFSVQGPDGWLKQKDNLGMLVTYVNPGNPETFQENITVARELKADLDLAAYVETTQQQLAEFFETYQPGDQKEVRIKGQLAKRLNYQIKVEDLELKAEQLIIDRPSEFLVITYLANIDTFESSKPGLNSVVGSLKFFEQEAEENEA